MNIKNYDLTFLRHGESEGNALGVIQGQRDYPLSQKGQEQVEALAERWQRENRFFDLILASPLTRAKETAEILAAALGSEVLFDEVWMERDFGGISGQPVHRRGESESQEPFIHPYSFLGETGESILQFFLRGGHALQSIFLHPPGQYLVVAHGGILNMVIYAILGIAPAPNFLGPHFNFRNAAFATAIYDMDGNRWWITGIDDQRHWENRPPHSQSSAEKP